MQLTTKTRYGVRALVDVAMHNETGHVNLGDISSRQEISREYLEQIFKKLKDCGIVAGRPGPGGGYVLMRPARDVTVADVMRCLEGSICIVPCENPDTGKNCHRMGGCVTSGMWKRAGIHMERYLDSVTIQEICEEAVRQEAGKQH